MPTMAKTNEVGSRAVLVGCQVSFSPIARRCNETNEAHEVTCPTILRTVPTRHPIHSLAQWTTNLEESDNIGSTEYDADDIVCGGFPGHANSETDQACGVEANILFMHSQFSPS